MAGIEAAEGALRSDVDGGYDGSSDHSIEMSALLAMLSEAGFASAGCFWRYLNFAVISANRAAV
jgi:hypothetical protein